jgi:hypothetical protein
MNVPHDFICEGCNAESFGPPVMHGELMLCSACANSTESALIAGGDHVQTLLAQATSICRAFYRACPAPQSAWDGAAALALRNLVIDALLAAYEAGLRANALRRLTDLKALSCYREETTRGARD